MAPPGSLRRSACSGRRRSERWPSRAELRVSLPARVIAPLATGPGRVGATRALLLLRSTVPTIAVDDEPARMRSTVVLFAMEAMPGLRLGASLLVARLVQTRDVGGARTGVGDGRGSALHAARTSSRRRSRSARSFSAPLDLGHDIVKAAGRPASLSRRPPPESAARFTDFRAPRPEPIPERSRRDPLSDHGTLTTAARAA